MTLAELRKAALQELRVIAAGEEAAPEDDAKVAEKYTALYEMLVPEGLVSWSSTGEVPQYAEIPITWMLAFHCANAFGVPPERMVELRGLGALNLSPIQSDAERMLRRQLAKNYVPHPARSEYF